MLPDIIYLYFFRVRDDVFAVIFKAKVGIQDEEYLKSVTTMRELAFSKYNCQDFIALTEGDQEIAISYWLSETDIKNWHQDSQHRIAQQTGKSKWYSSYSVEITEIKRQYHVEE